MLAERPIALYSTLQQKPVLIFSNSQFAGMYISKDDSIKKRNLCSYAKVRGCVTEKICRFNEKLAVRFATPEQAELLKDKKVVVLDEYYRNPNFSEKQQREGGLVDVSVDRVRRGEEHYSRNEKLIKAIPGWENLTTRELAEQTGLKTYEITPILRDSGIGGRKNKLRSVRVEKESLSKAIERITSKVGKEEALKILNQLIEN